MLRSAFLFLFALQALGADRLLFTSFRGTGDKGIFFAISADGRKWTPLNQGEAWLRPLRPGTVMRDPWLGKGPDGLWHLLWTEGWTRLETGGSIQIGHATSRDLLTFSTQQEIPLFQSEPNARNAWAPEAIWNDARKEWILIWATTITGRFVDTDRNGENGYNHRIYASNTTDWVHFTPARLYFDPGFSCIDASVVHDGDRWIMIFKDEQTIPLQKKLRLAFATSPEGPWTGVTQPVSQAWVEGPSAIRMGKEWWIYYDRYARQQFYGALATSDWKTFRDITSQLKFPEDHRHGTVVRISEETAKRLEAHRP